MVKRKWRDVRLVRGNTVREVHKWDNKHHVEYYSLEEYRRLMIEGHQTSKVANGKFVCQYCGEQKQLARLNTHRHAGCDEHHDAEGLCIRLKVYPNLLTDKTAQDMEDGRVVVNVINEYNRANPMPPGSQRLPDVADPPRRLAQPRQGNQLPKSPRRRSRRPREDDSATDPVQSKSKKRRRDLDDHLDVGSARSHGGRLETTSHTSTTSSDTSDSSDSHPERREGLGQDPLTTSATSTPATPAVSRSSDATPSPSTTTAIREDRRAAEARFRAQAAVEEPLPEVSEPSTKVPKTALAWLIESGLMTEPGVAESDRDSLFAALSTFVASSDRALLASAAFGRFVLQYHTAQGSECPAEVFQDALRLSNELVNPPADGGVDVLKYAGTTTEYYANIRAWRAFEIDTRTHREASERRERKVESLLAQWDQTTAVEIESAAWGWHPLYDLCALNPYLRPRLPPMPWDHTQDEATRVLRALRASRTAAIEAPVEARVLRVHMLSIGYNHVSVADARKGATDERIRLWAEQPRGFSADTFICETLGQVLFADNATDWTTVAALATARNALERGNRRPVVAWVHTIQARALEDLAASDGTSLCRVWQVVDAQKAGSIEKWEENLRFALRKREDLDLHWIARVERGAGVEQHVLDVLRRIARDRFNNDEIVSDPGAAGFRV